MVNYTINMFKYTISVFNESARGINSSGIYNLLYIKRVCRLDGPRQNKHIIGYGKTALVSVKAK